jgi:hypothetical protein
VGQVSSGGYGYSVGKSLALAYLKAGRVAPGETVHVAILGRPHTARRLAEAPFDPEGLRLRDKVPGGGGSLGGVYRVGAQGSGVRAQVARRAVAQTRAQVARRAVAREESKSWSG